MSYKVIFKKVPVSVWISLVVLTVFALQISWPMMQLRWDLVDDGITLAAAQLIENSLDLREGSISKPLFIEDQFVRFRPVFWLWFWLQFHLFGVDPSAFHFIRVMMFVMSAWLVFAIIKRLTTSTLAAFLSASLYLVQPHDISNWYYLGHHEALQNFFLLASLYAGILYLKSDKKEERRYFAWGAWALIPGVFWSKETSLALIPTLMMQVGYAWYMQRREQMLFWLKYLAIATVCSIILFGTLKYLSYARPDGYFSMYQTSSSNTLLHTLNIYKRQLIENFSLLYILPFVSFVIHGGWKFARRNFTEIDWWQVFFMSAHVAFFVILIPFSLRAEGYYLAPSLLMFILFAGIEAARALTSKKIAIRIIVIGLFVFLITRNYIQVTSFVDEFVTVQLSNSEMMEYVVSQTPSAPNALFNFSESDRGYIAGVRIQRASIFPCNQVLLTDPNVIYGLIDACPLQTMTHIPNADSVVDLDAYQLLVVGDTARNPVMPLDQLAASTKAKLLPEKSILYEITILDRSMTLEKYLKQSVRQFATNVRNTLRTRTIQMPFQPYPTRHIKSGWEVYRIEH